MSFSAKQLQDLGYIETSPGRWAHPSEVRDRDTNAVPDAKPDPSDGTEGEDATEVPVQGSVFGSVRVRLVVTSYRAVLADPDGPLPKWFIDGLVTHGIITDDKFEFVSEVVIRQSKCRRKDERTVLTLESMEPPPAPHDTGDGS